jgi:hypothetical protein
MAQHRCVARDKSDDMGLRSPSLHRDKAWEPSGDMLPVLDLGRMFPLPSQLVLLQCVITQRSSACSDRLMFVFLSWLCAEGTFPAKTHPHVTKYGQATCVFGFCRCWLARWIDTYASHGTKGSIANRIDSSVAIETEPKLWW